MSSSGCIIFAVPPLPDIGSIFGFELVTGAIVLFAIVLLILVDPFVSPV